MNTKKTFILILIPLLLCTCISKENETVLTHVTVVDVSGGPSQTDLTVVIKGDRISKIGKADEIKVSNDAVTIDASGKYLIPGLWDMHVHSSYTGWFAQQDKWFEENTEINKYIFFPLFIANGITGIRDMAGDFDSLQRWRRAIARGELLGPRIIISSPMLDGPEPAYPFASVPFTDEAEARQIVASYKKKSTDFIKLRNRVPRDAYFAIADECIKQGISFVGHLPHTISIIEACEAGQKSIEHFTMNWMEALIGEDRNEGLSRTRQLLVSYSQENATALSDTFVKNGTWFCPTLNVDTFFYLFDEIDTAGDPRLKYIPSYWINANWKPAVEERLKRFDEERRAIYKALFNKQLEILASMNKAGVQILAGTDSAGPYIIPGFSLHEELVFYVDAGFTPLEALQTATVNPARFLGLEELLGTVKENKIADLVLLEADPLLDIKNTRRITAVVVNGEFHSRSDLDRILVGAERIARNN